MSSFSIASLKNAVDEMRVQYYPKNETERRVYEALSSKNWGASTTLLGEIASESYDYEKYKIIMGTIWTIMESQGSSWKQIFKCLSLIEFLVKNGAERVIEEARDHMRMLRSMLEYNFYEGNVDKGSGVREKSKQLIDLLQNNEMIREERDKARKLKNKFVGISNDGGGGGGSYGGYGNDSYSGGGGGGGSYGSDRRGSYDSDRRYDENRNDKYGSDRGSHRNDEDRKYDSERSDRRSAGSGGRYGGGAYDSEKPSRYSDDAPTTSSYDKDPYEEDTHKSISKSKKSSSATATVAPNSSTSSGKLKVSIKDAGTSSKHSAPAPAVDVFGSSTTMGDDFFSAPVAAPAPVFDAFGSSAPAATSNNNNFGFDAFAAPAAPVSAAPANNFGFDVFTSAPAPAPVHNTSTFDAFGGQPTNTFGGQPNNNFGNSNNNFGAFTSNPAPHVQPAPMNVNNNNFGNGYSNGGFGAPTGTGLGGYPAATYNAAPNAGLMPMGGPAMGGSMGGGMGGGMNNGPMSGGPMAGGKGNVQNKQSLASASTDSDFGDFEGPAKTQGPTWNSAVGGLVNLGSLTSNTSNDKPVSKSGSTSSNNYQSAAFAGLDGFSKAQQPMSVPSSGVPANRGPAMLTPNHPGANNMGMGMNNPGMGMGGGMNMGMGMGGGMNPNMNMGMGGGMGMNNSMSSMGGMPMNLGGHGNVGMGGPPMGMYNNAAPTNMNMNMGGGYPQPNMGYPNQRNPGYSSGF